MPDCYSIKKKCGVDTPSKKICKDIKNCPCWSPAVGCRVIGPPAKVDF